ncbi:phage tail tape measure protein [Furfurilactobacillus entadae]|uniref:phage tail tape measure protein n=1 Tax=Furfurilactobacillus entadae TaxID=2922307 RepID=UPI0035EA84F1
MAVDGAVRINVDLITKQALAGAKTLDQALKGVDVNPALATHVSEFTKSLAASRATVQQARAEVDKLAKSEGNNSDKLKEARKALAQAEAEQGKMIQQLKLSASAWKSVGSEQEEAGLKTSANVSKLKGLRTQLAANQAEIVRTADQLRHLTQDENANGAEVAATRTKYQQLQAQQQALVVESGKLDKAVGGLTPAMAASADKALVLSGRFKEAGENMQNLGRTATMGATLPIVTGFGLAYKAASDFQYQLQDIRKEVQAQGYSTQQVNGIMKQLSSDTLSWSKQFGVGTKEINDGMFELVSNGYNVKQAMGMMPSLLKTMTANSDKSGQSIKLTASMLEQFGQNLGSNGTVIKNGNALMNQMTEATHKSAMSLGDLQEISGNAGAAMHAMGVKTNEFLAISGRLKSAGIDASSVGTGLSAMMTRLGTGTGQAAADLKKYNIAIYDSHGKMKDVFDIIGQMQNAYKGMNDQERQKFMYDTIGQENMKVGMTLMDANLGRYKSLSDEIEHSNGTVDKYNKTMRDTSQFSQQQFKASLQALEIEFGQKLLPTITPVIKEITDLMKRFTELDGQTQQNIIHTALLVAAAGPALSLLGKGTSLVGLFVNKNTRLLEQLVRLTAGTKGVGGALEESAYSAVKAGTSVSGVTSKMGLFSTATRGVLSGLSAIGPMSVAADAGIGTLALGAAPAALAIAGIGTAAFLAIKSEREHEAEIDKHNKKIDEFGMNVSDATGKALKGFNDLHAGAENDMTLLDTSVGKQSQKLSSDVVDKYSKMADMVVNKFKGMKNDTLSVLDDIGKNFGEEGNQWAKGVGDSVKTRTDGTVSAIKDAKKTINDLYKSLDGDLSKANSTQQAELTDAQNTIAEGATVFAKSYQDQQMIYQRYVNDHGDITKKMYGTDQKQADKSYKSVADAADKDFKSKNKKLKNAYDQNEIDYKEYTTGLDAIDAEKTANKAKANIQYLNTEKAFSDKYKNNGEEMLRNGQKLNEAETRLDAQGNKQYFDKMDQAWLYRSAWIGTAKEDNEKYIQQQKTAHGTLQKNLDDYQKSQEKAYKAMGMSSKQAKLQAEVDVQDLTNTLSKSDEKIAAAATKQHASYVKGLTDGSQGSVTEVAAKWGLNIADATQKVDLGRYGKKSAQDFWNDFQSGSKVGFKEAEVYFQSMFDDWKRVGNSQFNDLANSEKSTLLQGLESGAVTMKQAVKQFGKSILDAFPQDLSTVGQTEWDTLRQGLENGQLKSADVLKKFGASALDIFPNDLTQLGENDIKTLQKGLGKQFDAATLQQKYGDQFTQIFQQDQVLSKIADNDMKTLQLGLSLGVINKDQLGAQYKQQLDSIYGQDLSKLGKDSISTLAQGYKLGIPEATTQMDALEKMVGDKTKIDVSGHGKETMATLNKQYLDGKVTSEDYFNDLAQFLRKTSNVTLTPEGIATMGSYNNGLGSQKEVVTGTVKGIRTDAESNTIPSGVVYSNGQQFSTGWSNGIDSKGDLPVTSTFNIMNGIVGNMNTSADAINTISKGTGGSGNAVSKPGGQGFNKPTSISQFRHATGTRGQLTRPELAMVGDGGRSELIDYGNGQLELSPDKPTMRHLPAGSTVFNGQDTLRVLPALKAMGVPMHATGTGGNIADWFKNLFGDVFKFFEHPIENWEKLIDQSYDMKPFGSDPTTIGSSTKTWEKKQTSFLEKLKQEIEAIGTGQGHVDMDTFSKAAHMAASLMNQTLSDGDIAHLYFQAMTESSANPSQGGGYDDHDGSGLPMGIFQYKRGTFSSWAVPGHTNILSLMDQLLAVLNDSNWRSDFPPIGVKRGWGPSGHPMYDKGGISYAKQLAWVSEHGQKEIHIPDDQSAYSKELTEDAVKMSFGQQAFVATTAEQASGFRPTVMAAPQPVQLSTQQAGQQVNNGGLGGELKGLVDALSSKMVNINLQLDNGVLFNAQYPLIKLALGQDVTIDKTRGGK